MCLRRKHTAMLRHMTAKSEAIRNTMQHRHKGTRHSPGKQRPRLYPPWSLRVNPAVAIESVPAKIIYEIIYEDIRALLQQRFHALRVALTRRVVQRCALDSSACQE